MCYLLVIQLFGSIKYLAELISYVLDFYCVSWLQFSLQIVKIMYQSLIFFLAVASSCGKKFDYFKNFRYFNSFMISLQAINNDLAFNKSRNDCLGQLDFRIQESSEKAVTTWNRTLVPILHLVIFVFFYIKTLVHLTKRPKFPKYYDPDCNYSRQFSVC